MNSGARLTLGNVSPTADNHAVRKKYVDDNFVLTTGGVDTFTGQVDINAAAVNEVLIMRSQAQTAGSFNNIPNLGFYNAPKTTRYGYIRGGAASLDIVGSTGGVHVTSAAAFTVNSGSGVNVTSGSGDIVLTSGGGQVRTSDALYTSGGSNRFFGADTNIVNSGPNCRVSFYTAGTNVDSIGTRSGLVGYDGDGHLRMTNFVTSASIFLRTPNAIVFQNGATPVEVARIDGGIVLVGKTGSSLATHGVELLGATGQIYATADTNVPSIIVNRQGTADVDGGIFTSFRHNNTEVGKIVYDTGTSHVVYSQTSDYRLKNIVGPVVDGLDRVRRLNPYRVTRKDSPAPVEHDAFIAHEVADVIPNVVSGVKDAVTPAPPPDEPPENYPPAGSILPQTLDYTGLITVSIAAIKDLADQVDALTARLEALEAA
jgi:hypothetical protein